MLSINFGFSQVTEKKLTEKDGISLSCEYVFEKSTKKKDKYLLIITVNNETNEDRYVSERSVFSKSKQQFIPSGTLQEKNLAKVTIDNAKSTFLNTYYVEALRSGYFTLDHKFLTVIKAKTAIIKKYYFSIEKGLTPKISGEIINAGKPLESFSLAVNSKYIEGHYLDECTSNKLELKDENGLLRDAHLRVYSSDSKFFSTWYQKQKNVFYKDDDSNTYFIYDEETKTIELHQDGKVCIWKKVE